MPIYKALSPYTPYISNGPSVFPFQVNANLCEPFRVHCLKKDMVYAAGCPLSPSNIQMETELKTSEGVNQRCRDKRKSVLTCMLTPLGRKVAKHWGEKRNS